MSEIAKELGEVVAALEKASSLRELTACALLLRTHHAALAAMMADAERYRWLRDNCVREWESDMDHDRGARSLDIDFDAPGWDLDSAIDTARQAAGKVG